MSKWSLQSNRLILYLHFPFTPCSIVYSNQLTHMNVIIHSMLRFVYDWYQCKSIRQFYMLTQAFHQVDKYNHNPITIRNAIHKWLLNPPIEASCFNYSSLESASGTRLLVTPRVIRFILRLKQSTMNNLKAWNINCINEFKLF